jgi:hypothetical protein
MGEKDCILELYFLYMQSFFLLNFKEKQSLKKIKKL